ncbi:MAG: arginine deiminase family protein [Blastocatellia bacterium]
MKRERMRRWPAAVLAGMLLLALTPRSESSASISGKGGVVSDIAPLRAAIVLALGEQIFKTSEFGAAGGNRHPIFGGLPRGVIREHQALRDLLRSQNVRVYDVRDLLGSAIRNARRQGTLAEWLRETFPATAQKIAQQIDAIDADSILNLRDDHFYEKGQGGAADPLFPGLPSMYWSRDFAISTPKGIVIGNGQYYRRALENSVARLIFRHADEVKSFPIVFDAAREGVYLDGGDLIVLDDKTLLLGVGNRSSREAAAKLAQQLDMDVLAVAMPPVEKQSGLNRQLLHLDSIFNLVDRNRVLAVPFFLEKEYSDSNPLKPLLLGLAAQTEEIRRRKPEREMTKPDDLRLTVEVMPQVGWVTKYHAGSGTPEPLDLKLVDYFRQRGYQVVYVGGERGKLPVEKYLVERAMYELRWQGANVVQLRPGRVIAYEHNVHTNEALRSAGVEVLTFPGDLLSLNNGGPHCLLMPLIRGGD